MESTIHEASGTTRELEVTLGKAEIEPYINKVLRETQKNYQRPGFRKGHVPLSVIRQLHGPALEGEAIESAIQQEFGRLVGEQNLRPIGTPSITRIDRTDDGGISFTVVYEVLPEFELGEYKSLQATKLYHIVSEEELNHELDHLRERYVTEEPAESVEDENHMVTIDLHKVDDGVPSPEPGAQDMKLLLRRPDINPELVTVLRNTKVGDAVQVDLPTGENQSPIRYEVRVKEVAKAVLPELDDAFAQKVTGEEDATVQDLIDLIKQEIERHFETRYSGMMRDELVGRLIEAHDVAVPQVLVNDVLNAMVDENRRGQKRELPAGFDRAKFEQEMRPVAERTARWMLVRDKIIEKEGLAVDDVDYEGLAQVESARTGIDPATLTKYFKSQPSTAERILAEKVLQFLEDYAVLQEIEDTEAEAQNASPDEAGQNAEAGAEVAAESSVGENAGEGSAEGKE